MPVPRRLQSDKDDTMKTQILISLLLASGLNTAAANSNFLLTSAEVAAGRNLRNNGTQFCEVTINSGASHHSEALAIITLPKGARLLDSRVKRPSRTQSDCSRSQLRSSVNTIQCKLTRMIPNQKITLVTRYHQSIPSRGKCTGYIKVGSRQ